jgi:hypothetical protein
VRPWASVSQVETADGPVWFKACSPVQAFEPRLTAQLFGRWPDRVARVLGHDEDRAWLLTADAGRPIGELGNPPEIWERVLPRYAELQRDEIRHAPEHLRHGVPDLRPANLPAAYAVMLERSLPLEPGELGALRAFEPRFGELCEELAAEQPGDTVQHDDLHLRAVFARGDELRILDWGDASIGHPFFSLVVTFRFLEEINGLAPDDPWFDRLRDAYLEPWGRGLGGAFARAYRVGLFAHPIAWVRQRDQLSEAARQDFDVHFRVILRRAIAAMGR